MFKEIITNEIHEYAKYCNVENADEGLFMVMGVVRLFFRLGLISVDFMEHSVDLAFEENKKLKKITKD